MEIKLMAYELQEAIVVYLKAKYNVEISCDTDRLMHVLVSEHSPKYMLDAKDDVGFERDEEGHAIIDGSQPQYVKHCLPFNDLDSMTFHAQEVKNSAPLVDERGNCIEPCGCIEARVLDDGHYCDTVLNGTGAE